MTYMAPEEVQARAAYQLATVYASPNACVACSKTDNGVDGRYTDDKPGMADLGRDIDWYGVVYLCRDCAFQIAAIWGGKTPKEYAADLIALGQANEECARLRKENLALKKVVDGYIELGNLVTGDFTASLRANLQAASDHPVADPNPGTQEPTKITESSDTNEEDDGSRVSEGGGSEQGPGNSEINKSSDQPRSDDFSDDPVLRELLG